MKERLSITYTVVLTVIMTVMPTMAEVCQKFDTCKCKAGSFTVDLTQLLDGTNPRFAVRDPNKSQMFYYMPCQRLDTSNYCKTLQSSTSMAICQMNPDAFDIGDINTEQFSGDPMNGTLNIAYQGPDQRYTSILLQCGDDTRMEFISELPTKTYNFKLYTPLLCTGTAASAAGLSIGSVLVIIFFVTFALYWIFGILFMKFVRRAQGTEMIPNLEFWKELPLVIRDGFAFTVRGCKGETTYEKI